MNKILSRIFCSLLIGYGLLMLAAPVALAAPEPTNPVADFEQVIGDTGLTRFEGRYHPLSSTAPGADIITSVLFTAIDFLKYFLGAVAVLYMMYAGVQLITAEAKVDEVAQKQKDALKYIVYGLVLVIIADELVTKVFFGDYGECIASASNAADCAKAGSTLVSGLYSFILAILASFAIFILVLSAFRLATSMGEEETINQNKKRIVMAVVGLLVAGVAEFAIKAVVFPEAGTRGIDVLGAQRLVYNFTNFISAFIGAASFLVLFYAGWLYVSSGGNEEGVGKAKKAALAAIIGILVALAAFGVVRTIITFSPGGEITLPSELPGLP